MSEAAGANGASPSQGAGNLDWLLNSFVERMPGAVSAVVVTTDGLSLALSERIDRDSADQLAAITSALASLTAGAAKVFETAPVNQVIVEMAGGYLFVSTVSEGSALAVLCDTTCDIGLIGYELTLLVARIGQVLTPELRAELRGPPLT